MWLATPTPPQRLERGASGAANEVLFTILVVTTSSDLSSYEFPSLSCVIYGSNWKNMLWG